MSTEFFNKVNAAVLPSFGSLVRSWLPGGDGDPEYKVRNPRRDDKSSGSFLINLRTAKWGDFAVDGQQGGDPVSLYAFLNNLPQGKAAAELARMMGLSDRGPDTKKRGKIAYLDMLCPCPEDAPPPPDEISKFDEATKKWISYPVKQLYLYRNALGQPLFCVVRIETPTGKEVIPLTLWKTAEHGIRWRQKGCSTPRPLYGHDRLAQNPAAQVVLVEGEKCAETGQGLVDSAGVSNKIIFMTWPGGCKSVMNADWTSLQGKKVLLWPDNDEPGRKAMILVAGILRGLGCDIRMLEIPKDKPAGWDVADAILTDGWTLPQVFAFMKANRRTVDVKPIKLSNNHTGVEHPVSNLSVNSRSEYSQNIKALLWNIFQDKSLSSIERNRGTCSEVIRWLCKQGKFYSTLTRTFSDVLFFDNRKKILSPVQGDEFQSWLSDSLGIVRSENLFKHIAAGIETEGLVRGEKIDPSLYWTSKDGKIFISNGPGSMVQISAGAVKMVDNGTDSVLFRSVDCLKSWNLIEPIDPFEKCRLFSSMSADENGKLLFKLWSILLPSDQKTKPPLCVTGQIGSGKTRVIRGDYELYGMSERISHIKERDGESDFWATINGGGIVCLDNCDSKNEWLADALAAASTAGTFEKRKLYTDGDRVSLQARAWVAVTSSNPMFASDAGLADRLLVVRLDRRTGETAEIELSFEINKYRNAGLSFICYILEQALADRKPVPSGLNMRHPDWANMAVRVGRALGREEEAIACIRSAEADKSLFAVENDFVGSAILELCKGESFCGTIDALLDKLSSIDTSIGKYSTKRLARRISKLWPHLETKFSAERHIIHGGGFEYTFRKDGDYGDLQEAFTQNPSREGKDRSL